MKHLQSVARYTKSHDEQLLISYPAASVKYVLSLWASNATFVYAKSSCKRSFETSHISPNTVFCTEANCSTASFVAVSVRSTCSKKVLNILCLL